MAAELITQQMKFFIIDKKIFRRTVFKKMESKAKQNAKFDTEIKKIKLRFNY